MAVPMSTRSVDRKQLQARAAASVVARIERAFGVPSIARDATCRGLLESALHAVEHLVPTYDLKSGAADSLALNLASYVQKQLIDLDAAIGIYRNVLASPPASAQQADFLAVIYNNIGLALNTKHHFKEGRSFLLRSLWLYNRALGKASPDALFVLSNLALLESDAGRYGRAIRIGEILRSRLADGPIALEQRYPVMLANLGMAYLDSGRIQPARDTLAEAVRLLEAGADSAWDDLYGAYRQCATAETELEHYEAAEALYEKALHEIGKAYPDGHPDLAVLLTDYGRLHELRGLTDEAIKANLEAANCLEKFGLSEAYDMTTVLNNLGMLYRHSQDFAQAKVLLARALDMRERLLPPRHADLALLHQNLGVILHDMGDTDGAEEQYLQGLSVCQENLHDSHERIGTILDNLAGIYLDRRQFDLALTLRADAYEMHREAYGESNRYTIGSLSNLALTHLEAGEEGVALQMFEEALGLVEALNPREPAHDLKALVLGNIGVIHCVNSRLEAADECLSQALLSARLWAGEDHTSYADIAHNFAANRLLMQHPEEAETWARQALGIRLSVHGEDHGDTRKTRDLLENIQRQRLKTANP